MAERAMVLFSGGVDSTVCLALAIEWFGKDHVVPLSIIYGQKHVKEVEAAKSILTHYGMEGTVMDLHNIFAESNCSLLSHSNAAVPQRPYDEQLDMTEGKLLSTYVPFRNGLFLSVAASLALSKDCSYIYYGAHQDDAAGNAYPDCSEAFYTSMNTAVYEGSGRQLQVEAPFIQCSKVQVVREGVRLHAPLSLTWSCYGGEEGPCGVCATCIDRQRAFAANGL